MAITETSHALEVDAARWKAVLATARDAIVSIDFRGNITLFNRAAEQIFGYPAHEVIGKNIALLMPNPHREQHDAYIRSYQATGEARAIGRIREVEGLRKSGDVFPIELSVSEVRVGDEVLYTAILRDVSERRRFEQDLDRMRRFAGQRQRLADIGALTAKIVRDLANPLAALSMVSQSILRRIEREPSDPVGSVRSQVERLVATTSRLDAQLAEFKDFAREQRLELQEMDVEQFFGALEGLWRAEAARRGVQLEIVLPKDPITLRVDPEKLHRVFDNLVKNALEAIEQGPATVELRVAPLAGDRVRISVHDTGPGIPEGVDIFALFETTKPTGTGLGLPICRQIVNAHGGELCHERLEPTGAVFHVDLPLHGPGIA